MLTVAQLQIELTADTKKAEDALLRTSKQTKNTGQELEKTGGAFLHLPRFIGGAVSGLLNFGSQLGMTVFGLQGLAGGILSLGQTLLAGNANMEQTTVSFTTLLGSAKAAKDEIANLKQFAAATPFEFKDLASATQKLLAFGFQLKDTKPLLTAIGDALSSLGSLDPATLNQVVQVFGQMHASVHLQTQDLQQLASVGINAFQILADNIVPTKEQLKQLAHDGFGNLKEGAKLTEAEIQDLVTKGLIPSAQGIDALTVGIENNPLYKGGMAKQSTTFLGVLSTVQDVLGQLIQSLMSPVFDMAKQGLGKVADILQSKGFQDFAAGVGQKIADIFKKMGDFLGSKGFHDFATSVGLKILDVFHWLKDNGPKVADFLGQIKDHFLKAFGGDLGGKLQKVGQFLKDMWIDIQPIATWAKDQLPKVAGFIGGVASAFFGLIGYLDSHREILEFIAIAWGAKMAISWGIDAVKAVKNFTDIAKKNIQEFTDKVNSGITKVEDFSDSMKNRLIPAAKDVGDTAKTSAGEVDALKASEQAAGEKAAAAAEQEGALALSVKGAGEKAAVAAGEMDAAKDAEIGLGQEAATAGGEAGLGAMLGPLAIIAATLPFAIDGAKGLGDALANWSGAPMANTAEGEKSLEHIFQMVDEKHSMAGLDALVKVLQDTGLETDADKQKIKDLYAEGANDTNYANWYAHAQEMYNKYKDMKDQLKEASYWLQQMITAQINTGNYGGGGGPRPKPQAKGGPVFAGMPYTVGEEGRETFVPDVSGFIIPHVPTERILAAPPPAVHNYDYSVNVQGLTYDQVIQEIKAGQARQKALVFAGRR